MEYYSIVVDIDGVCANTLPVMLEVLNNTFNQCYTPDMCVDYDLALLYGPEARKVIEESFIPISMLAEPMKGASKTLWEIRNNNITIIYATARSKRCFKSTLFWLWQYNFPPGDLLIVESKASPMLVTDDVIVVVEDNPHEALAVAPYKPVLLYDWPYNRNVRHPNIIRVRTWREIKERIIALKEGR